MGQKSSPSDVNGPLLGLARQRAFDTYLRFGRRPEPPSGAVERKAVDPAMAVPGKATRFYVWRSAGDDKVRDSHAEHNGRVFAWAKPPAGGHPGTEPNCRCWAEPYYGDPAVPDALQPLQHDHQVDATGLTAWASIETLTRSDGSLAQSLVTARDGTQIRSEFAGTLVSRRVTLPTGETVRVDSRAGAQSVSIGDDPRPLFQSAWTARGPKVIRARQHVAFLGDAQTLIDPDVSADPTAAGREPAVVVILPNMSGLLTLALVSLYSMLQAAPASQGLSEGDEPVLAARAWKVGTDGKAAPVFVGSLSEEQLRQHCHFLPDVQKWTDDAAALLAEQKPILPATTWGSLVHGAIKRTIDALKKSNPFTYENLHPEISFYPDRLGEAPYGQKGSTRLDVVEDRREEFGAICDYDVKTGREGLTLKRLKEIADRLAKNYLGAIIYIIEVRPRP